MLLRNEYPHFSFWLALLCNLQCKLLSSIILIKIKFCFSLFIFSLTVANTEFFLFFVHIHTHVYLQHECVFSFWYPQKILIKMCIGESSFITIARFIFGQKLKQKLDASSSLFFFFFILLCLKLIRCSTINAISRFDKAHIKSSKIKKCVFFCFVAIDANHFEEIKTTNNNNNSKQKILMKCTMTISRFNMRSQVNELISF